MVGDRTVPRRADIQFLRALAVLLVVAYHAGLPGVGGGFIGVDVFFVISGYLITRKLIQGLGEEGVGFLPRFYASRVRRLAAPAIVVALVTVATSMYFSAVTAKSVATDAIASLLGLMNIHLIITGSSYESSGSAPSPLMHYWSLAVEEQFYLVWPLVLSLILLVCGKRFNSRLVSAMVLGCVVALSLIYASHLTPANPDAAYFNPLLRCWELGVGSLLAFAPAPQRSGSSLHAFSRLAGLAVIVWSGHSLTIDSGVPGYVTVIPVAATALMLWCGERLDTPSWMAVSPIQRIGDVSYSFYLWHWPVLALAAIAMPEATSPSATFLLVLASYGLAEVTYTFVETPLRNVKWPTWKPLATGAGATATACAVLVALAAFGPSGRTTPNGVSVASPVIDETSTLDALLSEALLTTVVPSNITPALDTPASGFEQFRPGGCTDGTTSASAEQCSFGDTTGNITIALVGDSHAEQWLPALDSIGTRNGYRIVSWTMGGCPLAGAEPRAIGGPEVARQCDDFRSSLPTRLKDLSPDLIIAGMSNGPGIQTEHPEAWASRSLGQFRTLAQAGAPVIPIIDNYFAKTPPAECLAANKQAARTCTIDPAWNKDVSTFRDITKRAWTNSGLSVIDSATLLCADKCPAIVGNVQVWRDTHHITHDYSKLIAPWLEKSLTEAATTSGAPLPTQDSSN